MTQITHSTVIITGASSGIGESTARYFADNDCFVILVARSENLLQKISDEINAKGGQSTYKAVDLADDKATSQLAKELQEEYGSIDILVNNAGYGPPFALEQMDRNALRHAFDVNVLSGMQLISELTPSWRTAGGGRVVNVSSLTRYVSAPVASTYAGTKGAMESMTDCLRLELAPWNIQLSLVIPGFVDTPTFDKSREVSKDMMEDPNNPYQKWMQQLDAFSLEQADKAITAEAVAKVIYQAATCKKPKARYFLPFSSKFAAILFGILPDQTVDKILLKLYRWGN